MKQDHGCTRSRSWFVCVGVGVRVGVVRCRRERSARRLRQVQFHKINGFLYSYTYYSSGSKAHSKAIVYG